MQLLNTVNKMHMIVFQTWFFITPGWCFIIKTLSLNFIITSVSSVASLCFDKNICKVFLLICFGKGSNHHRCSVKKVFLKFLQISLENTCIGVFLIKLLAWRSVTLFKKRLHHSCFPVNITKFLRTAFCMEHLKWLLLKMGEEF